VSVVTLLVLGIAWVGHAGMWTAVMNHLYGRPLNKTFLKLWRLFTGVVILAFPLIFLLLDSGDAYRQTPTRREWVFFLYFLICLGFSFVFLTVTLSRLARLHPSALLSEHTVTHDFWPALGEAARGDGKHRYLTHVPFNDIFRVDVTELTLRLPRLPPKLDGLSILVLSDLHLHGTPSRAWFDAVFDELAKLPTPDVIALVGDYVDTDTHREWLAPLLGKLKWTEVGLAVLGNHDWHHHPEQLRGELANLGYTVLGNRWQEVSIRGERVVVIGHEGPWFRPPPDVSALPPDVFRLCLSHTPDHFGWAAEHGIDLTLSGHTHGGGIRIPVIGPIFTPCYYGRRYDRGVFERGRSLLVVGRGLSGKEPIRFRCNPQVLRVALKPSG
jgi:hypothetical protein